ncbi:hypothetical protein ACWD1Y_21445 [Streptomyces sp. NPDC002814]
MTGSADGAAALLILSALISGTIAVNDPAMTQFVSPLLTAEPRVLPVGAAPYRPPVRGRNPANRR